MSESDNNLLDDCIKHFINGMYDWVRVVDKNNNIVFINSSMAQGLWASYSRYKML